MNKYRINKQDLVKVIESPVDFISVDREKCTGCSNCVIICGMDLWKIREGSTPSWHLYPCFVDQGKGKVDMFELIHYLEQKRGIRIIPRYFPVHLANYMRFFGHRYGECPVCERVWFEEQLNLPINPRMPRSEVDAAVEAIKDGLNQLKR